MSNSTIQIGSIYIGRHGKQVQVIGMSTVPVSNETFYSFDYNIFLSLDHFWDVTFRSVDNHNKIFTVPYLTFIKGYRTMGKLSWD